MTLRCVLHHVLGEKGLEAVFVDGRGWPLRRSVWQQVLDEKGIAVTISMLCRFVLCMKSFAKKVSKVVCNGLGRPLR